jgi:mannosyltransferase OCH1-like enzyme
MIPKIIHQTWKTSDIPEGWKDSIPSWQQFHPGWQHILWTDADLERFIAERYPWFMKTYRAYPYHIQRVDAARYFILYEFGGIYSDLDILCAGNFDFLRRHEVVIPKTEPAGFSNDLMMARAQHPFFGQAIGNLEKAGHRFSRNPLIPRHFRVMLSAGPLYLTSQYRSWDAQENIFILPPSLYSGTESTSIVSHTKGNSWHAWDSRLLGWCFEKIQ